MASEYVAEGVYRVSGLRTRMKDGAWSSDPGMYLVADQTKLASIEGATPGDRAFTAGYRNVWQLAADGTTWVELPATIASAVAQAAASASAAAEDAARAASAVASIPADYTTMANDVAALKTEAAKSLTINAVPASALTLGGGWVDLAMTVDCDEILAVAATGRCVINLQYNDYTKVVCTQRETVQYPNLTPQVFFTGMSLDTPMYIINVLITADGAQAAVIGTVPIST